MTTEDEDMMELDAGTLTPETKLSELIEWDSIAALSFIAMIDEKFDKIIKGAQIKQFKRCADALHFNNN